MKITIDTKDDSHEDIRKVIAMLTNFVEGNNSVKSENSYTDMFGSTEESPSSVSEQSSNEVSQGNENGFVNMFGSTEESSPEQSSPNVLDSPSEEQVIDDSEKEDSQIQTY